MRPRSSSAPALVGLLVPLALLAGCGGEDAPAALEPIAPPVPADLCELVPEAAKAGLETAANTDETGNPTASCGLTSAVGATPQVRGVVTTLQVNDPEEAERVLDSQCRAIDPQTYAVRSGYAVDGAESACAGTAKQGDSVTIAALRGRDVLTFRLSSSPAGKPDALTRGTQVLQGVLAELPDTTPTS